VQYNELPALSGVIVRTVANYYNGPLCGLAAFDGRLYWYNVRDFDFEDENTPWEYVLYDITEDEVAAEQERNEAFRAHVGTHEDLDETGRKIGGVLRDQSGWSVFYDAYPPNERPTYKDRPQVGRFEIDPRHYHGRE
jgi:hypothetical protein